MKSILHKITLAIVLLVAALNLQSCNYNSLVEKQQAVDQSWAEVENQYQRRASLIPNLVNTVKGYAAHESQTLEKVTQARAAATSITISADNLNEETLAKYQQAQGELSQALKSLLAVSEAYPDLKANENFMALQAQLEGTENRIAAAVTRRLCRTTTPPSRNSPPTSTPVGSDSTRSLSSRPRRVLKKLLKYNFNAPAAFP